jgi:urea transport system permease protein
MYMLAMTWQEIKEMDPEILKGALIMQGFAGFQLFGVFLLMALGLAIIFGQMRVINMAHGEFLSLGAYATVWCSHLVDNHAPSMLPYYFPFAILLAFIVAFIVGYFVEILLVRYLYLRPLDTLLATWGVSLILQQTLRSTFGAREDSATMPEWLLGSWSPTDNIDISKSSVYLLGLAIVMVILVYFLLYWSKWGLRVRATVQNRAMAGAIGINTKRTDRFTFALGCGIAGIAGAALTTYGSVSPSAGSLYIVDTFIVVVFGGAGSIIGTVLSAFTIAQAQSILSFILTGVLGKIFVLLGVIVLLMIRPKGLIGSKVRE